MEDRQIWRQSKEVRNRKIKRERDTKSKGERKSEIERMFGFKG